LREANTLLKDEESARGNHVFACNFAKYSPILKNFSLSVCARWVLATPETELLRILNSQYSIEQFIIRVEFLEFMAQ